MQLTVMIKTYTEYEAMRKTHFMTSGAGIWYLLSTMEVITELLCMLFIWNLQLHSPYLLLHQGIDRIHEDSIIKYN